MATIEWSLLVPCSGIPALPCVSRSLVKRGATRACPGTSSTSACSVRFAGRMCRETVISQAPSWYTLPYVDDYPIMTFPTASLLFSPLSLPFSLSLFCPFFIRATIEKPWTVGSRVEFSIAAFFLWIFLWTSVDFTRREGGLNNTKNERRMHNADFTTSLCVRGDWRDKYHGQ